MNFTILFVLKKEYDLTIIFSIMLCFRGYILLPNDPNIYIGSTKISLSKWN